MQLCYRYLCCILYELRPFGFKKTYYAKFASESISMTIVTKVAKNLPSHFDILLSTATIEPMTTHQ